MILLIIFTIKIAISLKILLLHHEQRHRMEEIGITLIIIIVLTIIFTIITFPNIWLILLFLSWLLEKEIVVRISKHILSNSSRILNRHRVLMLEKL